MNEGALLVSAASVSHRISTKDGVEKVTLFAFLASELRSRSLLDKAVAPLRMEIAAFMSIYLFFARSTMRTGIF